MMNEIGEFMIAYGGSLFFVSVLAIVACVGAFVAIRDGI